MRESRSLRDRRPPLLAGADGRREITLESGHVVTSAPGYALFIQAVLNGRWQAVAVDLGDLAALTSALEREAGRV
jgi:hypothetical protein